MSQLQSSSSSYKRKLSDGVGAHDSNNMNTPGKKMSSSFFHPYTPGSESIGQYKYASTIDGTFTSSARKNTINSSSSSSSVFKQLHPRSGKKLVDTARASSVNDSSVTISGKLDHVFNQDVESMYGTVVHCNMFHNGDILVQRMLQNSDNSESYQGTIMYYSEALKHTMQESILSTSMGDAIITRSSLIIDRSSKRITAVCYDKQQVKMINILVDYSSIVMYGCELFQHTDVANIISSIYSDRCNDRYYSLAGTADGELYLEYKDDDDDSIVEKIVNNSVNLLYDIFSSGAKLFGLGSFSRRNRVGDVHDIVKIVPIHDANDHIIAVGNTLTLWEKWQDTSNSSIVWTIELNTILSDYLVNIVDIDRASSAMTSSITPIKTPVKGERSSSISLNVIEALLMPDSGHIGTLLVIAHVSYARQGVTGTRNELWTFLVTVNLASSSPNCEVIGIGSVANASISYTPSSKETTTNTAINAVMKPVLHHITSPAPSWQAYFVWSNTDDTMRVTYIDAKSLSCYEECECGYVTLNDRSFGPLMKPSQTASLSFDNGTDTVVVLLKTGLYYQLRLALWDFTSVRFDEQVTESSTDSLKKILKSIAYGYKDDSSGCSSDSLFISLSSLDTTDATRSVIVDFVVNIVNQQKSHNWLGNADDRAQYQLAGHLIQEKKHAVDRVITSLLNVSVDNPLETLGSSNDSSTLYAVLKAYQELMAMKGLCEGVQEVCGCTKTMRDSIGSATDNDSMADRVNKESLAVLGRGMRLSFESKHADDITATVEEMNAMGLTYADTFFAHATDISHGLKCIALQLESYCHEHLVYSTAQKHLLLHTAYRVVTLLWSSLLSHTDSSAATTTGTSLMMDDDVKEAIRVAFKVLTQLVDQCKHANDVPVEMLVEDVELKLFDLSHYLLQAHTLEAVAVGRHSSDIVSSVEVMDDAYKYQFESSKDICTMLMLSLRFHQSLYKLSCEFYMFTGLIECAVRDAARLYPRFKSFVRDNRAVRGTCSHTLVTFCLLYYEEKKRVAEIIDIGYLDEQQFASFLVTRPAIAWHYWIKQNDYAAAAGDLMKHATGCPSAINAEVLLSLVKLSAKIADMSDSNDAYAGPSQQPVALDASRHITFLKVQAKMPTISQDDTRVCPKALIDALVFKFSDDQYITSLFVENVDARDNACRDMHSALSLISVFRDCIENDDNQFDMQLMWRHYDSSIDYNAYLNDVQAHIWSTALKIDYSLWNELLTSDDEPLYDEAEVMRTMSGSFFFNLARNVYIDIDSNSGMRSDVIPDTHDRLDVVMQSPGVDSIPSCRDRRRNLIIACMNSSRNK